MSDGIDEKLGKVLRLLMESAEPPAPPPAEPSPPPAPAEPDPAELEEREFERRYQREQEAELLSFRESMALKHEELRKASATLKAATDKWQAEIDAKVAAVLTKANAAQQIAEGVNAKLTNQQPVDVAALVRAAIDESKTELVTELTDSVTQAAKAYASRVIDLKMGQLSSTIVSSRGTFNRYQPGLVPIASANPTDVLRADGTWGSGAGGVTSVAATVPSWMSVSGTPITTSGTLAFGFTGAKGDLIVGNGANSATNLSVGTDGLVLKSDSSQTTGVKWAGAITVLSSTGASYTPI